MTLKATVIELGGDKGYEFSDVEEVSFVNGDSFGDGQKIAKIKHGTLVLNANHITAAYFERGFTH